MYVDYCEIVNKISKNSYKMLIKFKKYSMISLARWVYVTVTAIKIQGLNTGSNNNKFYLLIRSCPPS